MYAALVKGNTIVSKSYKNNVLRCKFRRTLAVPKGSEMYMWELNEAKHVAVGAGNLGSDGKPSYVNAISHITDQPVPLFTEGKVRMFLYISFYYRVWLR